MTQQNPSLLQQMNEFIASQDETYQPDSLTSFQILVQQFIDLATTLSKKLAKRFNQLLYFHDQLFLKFQQNDGVTLTICSGFLQVFVIILQHHVSLIKKNKPLLINLLNRMISTLVFIPYEVSQQWCNPPQGFNQDEQFSQEAVIPKQILSYFDRIAAIYNYNQLVIIFKQILPEWYYKNQDDWRYRYAVFMVMSQLGQDPTSDVQTFVDCALDSISHPHPKVRFAVLQMIGQISDDMKPSFQQKYTITLLPLMINSLKDAIPRVHSHALACLTNFVEDYDNFSLISEYIDQIISLAFSLLQNGNSNTKQNAMSVFASVGTIKGITKQQIQKIIECSSYAINNFSLAGTYKQLINQTIQSLSIIIATQEKGLVQSYLNHMVTLLKQMMYGLSHPYFVSAWSRLCIAYENFTDISQIFPRVLQVVKQMIADGEQELQSAIGSLENTIKAFKTNLKAYTNQIIDFVKSSLNILPKEDKLRSNLYSILDALVTSLKCQAPDPQWELMAKLLIEFFISEADNILNDPQEETDYIGLQQALKGPENAIQCIGYLLTPDILKQIMSSLMNKAQKISQLISKINQNIIDINEQKLQQTDEQQNQQLDEFIELYSQKRHRLYESKMVIPDIFRSIIRVCVKNMHTNLINQIVQALSQHISQILNNHSQLQNIRYGIYYICNFIDELDLNQISPYLSFYEQILKQYSLSSNIFVRNSAVYGLGALFLKYPKNAVTNNNINDWLQTLWKSLNISNDSYLNKKQFNFAQDNIVSALGKCLISFGPSQILNENIYQKWIQYLPLNSDKIQGDVQQQYLINLLNSNPQLIVKNQQSLLKILTVFGKYLKKRDKRHKQSIQKIREKTKQCILMMKSWNLFEQSSNYLWQNLPLVYKNILANLMS